MRVSFIGHLLCAAAGMTAVQPPPAPLELDGFQQPSEPVHVLTSADMQAIARADRAHRASYGIPPRRSQEWRRRRARQTGIHPANPRRR
jgi:hypothetical protein